MESHTDICLFVYIYIYIYICLYGCICVCIYVCIYVCMNEFMDGWMYVCVHLGGNLTKMTNSWIIPRNIVCQCQALYDYEPNEPDELRLRYETVFRRRRKNELHLNAFTSSS